MSADAGVSLGVVVAGILIMIKGWLWIDPVVSLAVVAIIFIGTWGLLRDSFNYAIDAVPRNIDIAGIKKYIMNYERVNHIHDLHVWPLSTTAVALTVHIVVTNDSLDNSFLRELQQHLHDNFGIEHATIQLETSTSENDCMLDKYKCE